MNYYDRRSVTHLDGTPVFATDEDRHAQDDVAQAVEMAWGCEVRPFGPLSPVDCYATRFGRLVGVLEIKHRSHPRQQYPTVFLNVRKWLALSLAGAGLGCPALFVVQFTDGIWWIDVDNIDARRHHVGGCNGQVKAASDVEPVIGVPVTQLVRLTSA